MRIANDDGGPYFDALALVSAHDGPWFETPGDPVSITATCKLALAGGGNISGDLWMEFSADREKLDATKLVLPAGCLHSEYATITLSTAKVALASALDASVFGLTLSYPIDGYMRFRWNPTGIGSIVAGVNTIKMHVRMGQIT